MKTLQIQRLGETNGEDFLYVIRIRKGFRYSEYKELYSKLDVFEIPLRKNIDFDGLVYAREIDYFDYYELYIVIIAKYPFLDEEEVEKLVKQLIEIRYIEYDFPKTVVDLMPCQSFVIDYFEYDPENKTELIMYLYEPL